MLLLHTLLAATQPRQPEVVGHWHLARLCLDQAAGEALNVGVVFVEEDTDKVCSRFVRNVAALRCLYNDDLAEDAAFLIDQAERAIDQGEQLPQGWNITLTPALFARGASGPAIVDDLFSRLVPMGARETLPERLDGDDHAHTTHNVRKTVRQLLTRHMNARNAPEFWLPKPIETTRGDRNVRIDLQIQAPREAGRPLHGTIASAWYKTQYHRNAYLDKGATAMMLSTEVYAGERSVMYLLCPTERDGFTTPELRAIEDDVESIRWLLEQRRAQLSVFSSERQMAQQILEDVGAIST